MNDDLQCESFYFSRTSQKANTNEHTTRVLLVCVYNKSGNLITHDVFYRLFSKFGEVRKVLIFEKSKVWKTFVEMESAEVAVEAKLRLNNHMLFEDGSRMNIFFSNLEYINFQNSNSGGIDYTMMKARISNINHLMKEKSRILVSSDLMGEAENEEEELIDMRFGELTVQEEDDNSSLCQEGKALDFEEPAADFTEGAGKTLNPFAKSLNSSLQRLDDILERHKLQKQNQSLSQVATQGAISEVLAEEDAGESGDPST